MGALTLQHVETWSSDGQLGVWQKVGVSGPREHRAIQGSLGLFLTGKERFLRKLRNITVEQTQSGNQIRIQILAWCELTASQGLHSLSSPVTWERDTWCGLAKNEPSGLAQGGY